MAEFWVFDWTFVHDFDRFDAARIALETERNPDFPRKYAARYQAGDVWGVFPDGTTPPGRVIAKTRKDVCIKVPGISFEMAKQYIESVLDIEINERIPQKILKRRRFKVDWSRVPQVVKDQLLLTKTYTFSNLNSLRLIDKAG